MVLAELETKFEFIPLVEPLIFGSKKIYTQEEFDTISRQISHVIRVIEIKEARNAFVAFSQGERASEMLEEDLRNYTLRNLDILTCAINPL